MKAMAILKVIGKRIADERKKQGLTQEDLAGLCEMDRSYLSEIENGHKNPSVVALHKIVRSLNTDLSNFLREIK